MPRMDKLSTYCTTIAQAGDLIVVTYRKTQIVAFDRRYISLRTGGWDSVTTRRKMNQAANQFGLGYSVYRDKGESYVRTPAGAVVPLTDELVFVRG
jgi:hypothetical protein